MIRITNSKKCELIYRATVDGFTSKALHSECDDKKNLVSIIKNDLNHVFGGYTLVAWNIKSGWITDPKAFIFSLRRNGESQNDKFIVASTIKKIILILFGFIWALLIIKILLKKIKF